MAANNTPDVVKPDINALTRELRESVVRNYDDWKDDWFKSVFLSHEQVLEVNGESTSEGADEDEVVSATVAPCQAQRTIKIAHFHENVKKTPIPNTQFEVQEKDEGFIYDSWETVASGTTDANGLAEVTVAPGKEYRVVLSPDISQADMDTLYSSYDGFIESCCGVLQRAWDGGISDRWDNYLSLPEDQRSDAVYAGAVNGLADGFTGVIDDLKRIYEVICGLLDYDFSEMPDDLASQFEKLKEADDAYLKACLVANDEIFLFIVLYTVRQYFRLLTPAQMAEMIGELIGQILFDIVVGLLITGGVGLATKYGARVGTKAAARVVGKAEVDARNDVSLGDFLGDLASGFQTYMDDIGTNHRRLQFAGDGDLTPTGTVTGGALQRQHPAYNAVASDDRAVTLQARHQDSATVSERSTENPGPNEDSPSSTDQGEATQDIESTAHCGDPVSTVTGEEVLELVDARLEGPLPFEFKRVYRSGSSDRQLDMGYGWRHSLNHSLTFDRDGITWHDHEGKNTRLPSLDSAPFASNAQAGMAAWRDGNTIVACAGEKAPRYHFERHGDTGRLVRISDRYGNALRIDHDMHGRVQRVISGADQALAFEYQDERLVQVDLLHRELTHDGPAWSMLQTAHRYVYDEAGDLVEATNAAGDTERYAFDNHMLTRRTLASGYSFHLTWDEATPKGRCVHQWGDSPEVDTRFAWDDEKHTCTVTYADGSEEHWQYDGAAQLQTKIDPDGAEHLNEYDDQGRLTASTDPLGAKTTYSYDDSGRLMSKVGPDDQPIQFAYKQGRIASIHRRGQTWQFAYTAEGDLARETDPKGRVTAYHYNRQGQLSQVELPDGRFHTWQWNDKGQLLEERTPTGAVEKYRYDAFGRLLARKDARGAITQYVHDPLGRVIEERLSGNRSRRYAYNSFGKVTRFTDEQGRETRYEYDRNLHLLSRRINPDGSELRYRYDHHRFLLTQIENERGETYRIDYYPNGLVRQETAFDGRRTGYSYDLNGHLLEKTEYGTGDDALQTTVYERDPLGQLSKKILPDGREIAYAYNPDGQLTGVDDGHWPLAFQYDEQGLLRTEHQGWATLQYHYDDVDRLTGLTLPDGQTLGYERDAAGLLAGINLNSAVLTRHRLSSTGEEMERQQGALFSAYEYDDEGRLTQHRLHQQKAQGILQQRDYRYDTSGNLQSISDSRKGLREYVYDPRDRLTGVRGDVYERLVHDPAGNLLEQTESAAGPAQANVQGNRLTMHGDCHYEYDDFGNLIAERRGKDQKLVTTYRYDCEHRLVEVIRPDGLSFRYEYDAFGRRIAKESDHQRTEFVWQGDRLIAEETGDHYRTYLYEPDSFRPLALSEGYGPEHSRVYYYQLDHLGTPQEMTDANGQLVWSATYRAYGNVLRQDVAVVDNPLRFQGQYYDPETGLHYNRHRYYNPANGRFMTPDPIGLAGGLNNYQYVPNPTGWVDPLGLACEKGSCPASPSTKVQEVRRQYVEEIYQLEHAGNALSESGHDPEFIARRLHQMRREIGIKYKHLTPLSQRIGIYVRNIAPKNWTFLNAPIPGTGRSILPSNLKPQGYDSILGPSVNWLRDKKGKSWEDIIKSASDPNAKVTRSLGIEPNEIRLKIGLPPLEE